jgi:hypothetical protein
LELRNHPFYRHARTIAFYERQLERIEPTSEEMNSKFDAQYGNTFPREHNNDILRLLGQDIPEGWWTQTPREYLPPGMVVDRRINRDRDFVYVRASHDQEQAFRVQKLRSTVGLLPQNDVIVYRDFDDNIMKSLEAIVLNEEPSRLQRLFVEVDYCPNSHLSVERDHSCQFCTQLSNAEHTNGIPEIALVKVTRRIYRLAWVDPQPPPDPDTDNARRNNDNGNDGNNDAEDDDDDSDDDGDRGDQPQTTNIRTTTATSSRARADTAKETDEAEVDSSITQHPVKGIRLYTSDRYILPRVRPVSRVRPATQSHDMLPPDDNST